MRRMKTSHSLVALNHRLEPDGTRSNAGRRRRYGVISERPGGGWSSVGRRGDREAAMKYGPVKSSGHRVTSDEMRKNRHVVKVPRSAVLLSNRVAALTSGLSLALRNLEPLGWLL